jgi:hypothetical protein
MSAGHASHSATELVAQLSVNDIRRRLGDLAAERDALLVLLRAALSRDRQKKVAKPSIGRGGR